MSFLYGLFVVLLGYGNKHGGSLFMEAGMKSSLIGRGEGVLKSGEGLCPSVIEESRLGKKVRRDSRQHNSLGHLLASCVVF